MVFLNCVALFSTDFANAKGKENKPISNDDINNQAFLTFLFCIGTNFLMLKNKTALVIMNRWAVSFVPRVNLYLKTSSTNFVDRIPLGSGRPSNFADRTGLEPATSAVTGRHSNQLNYRSVPLNESFRHHFLGWQR